MKRRDFVRNSLLMLSALALPNLSACRKNNINGEEVIVIGAGMAGLAAATKLKEAGFSVRVIEARGSVGGRVRTNRSAGFAFDEGASWIHGAGTRNPIRALASEAGATHFVTDDESVKIYEQDGIEYSDAAFNTGESNYEAALAAIQSNASRSESFLNAFNRLYPNQIDNRLWKYLLSSYLEFNTGGDISELSATDFYDDEEFSGDEYLITNGYDTIANHLAAGLDVRLNEAVQSIDYSTERPSVRTSAGTYTAQFIVLTVPLGVLKANHISFTPALPSAKTQAISDLGMGNVNKFWLRWDTAFWDNSLSYIACTPSTKGAFNYFLNCRKFSSYNALMTFALGSYATTSEALSDAEIIDAVMQNLRPIYGASTPAPVELLRTRWASDAHTLGAYSFPRAGAGSAPFLELAKALQNRLFFAGEHTSHEYRGSVHGAYLSGIRAADELIDLF